MSNNFTAIVNLGSDPESIKFGERECYKLRMADKGIGKDATTRWITAIVSGPGATTAARLSKGDAIAVTGTLVRKEYASKKPRYKGEMIVYDDMPYCTIMQVVKSETFFNRDVGDFPPTDTSNVTVPIGSETSDVPNDTEVSAEVNKVMEGL